MINKKTLQTFVWHRSFFTASSYDVFG